MILYISSAMQLLTWSIKRKFSSNTMVFTIIQNYQKFAIAINEFENIVSIAEEATPLSLTIGTNSRPSVGELYDSIRNPDRVHYHVHQITTGKAKSDIGIIASIDKILSNELIVSSNLNCCVVHIILHTPSMKRSM